jgi:hypothetical protein
MGRSPIRSGRAFAIVFGLVAGCAARGAPVERPDLDRLRAQSVRTKRAVSATLRTEPPAIEVGQWAAYERVVGGEHSIDRYRVVAHDGCGWWFERVRATTERWERHLFCWRPPDPAWRRAAAPVPRAAHEALQVVIVATDSWAYHVHDFQRRPSAPEREAFADLVTTLGNEPWPDGDELPRDDLLVASGPLAQALRVTTRDARGERVRWLHPEVPFGGTVKVRERGGRDEIVLIDFGEGACGCGSGVADLANTWSPAASHEPGVGAPRMHTGTFLGFGVQMGWLRDEQSIGFSQSLSLRLGLQRRRFGVLLDVGAPMLGAEPVLSSLSAGLRWMPYSSRTSLLSRPRASALYVQAALGLSSRSRQVDDHWVSSHGVLVGAAVGLGGGHAVDWLARVELLGQVHVHPGEQPGLFIGIAVVYELYGILPGRRY